MSMSKYNFDKAKKRASERIENWIQNAQRDEQNGISRLISNYPGVLRRIQFNKSPNISTILKQDTFEPTANREHSKECPRQQRQTFFTGSYKQKPCSVSAENIPAHPPSEQRKTISDGSLCETRIESQRGRFSRRSSRLSTEDPFRLCLWSSRDLSKEPCASKLSNYGLLKDSDCLEVTCQEPEKRPSSHILAMDKTLQVIPSPTCLSTGSPGTPSKHRRRSRKKLKSARSRTKEPVVSQVQLSFTPTASDVSTAAAAPQLIKIFKKIYNIVRLFKCTSRQLSGEFDNKETVFKIIEDGKILIFDPREFRASSKSYGGLSKRTRKALEKKPGHRSKDDIGSLIEVINRLPMFSKYSRPVKEALADRLLYDRVGGGRVIIKQGQVGSNVYCVVSGTLSCRTSETDPRTGEKIVTYLPDLKAGTTFGELALVRDIKRTATVVSKSDCELLMLGRDDFNKVLREIWEMERRQRQVYLHQSQHFRSWADHELAALADVATTEYYSDNDVILGDVTGISPFIYFIVSGSCRVVKQVKLVRLKSPYQPSLYELPHMTSRGQFLNKAYARAQRRHDLETHNLTIFELKEDDCMGVGENLRDVHVIAKGKVVCVKMNSVQFEIFAKKKELQEMAEKRQELLPGNASLYRRLLANMRWSKYKRRVVEEVVGRKKIPDRASLLDVPWSIRMEPRV